MSEGPEGAARREGWLRPTTVLLILTGILVPIVAALIPAGLEYLRTPHDFSYITESIGVGNRAAFMVRVRNRGRIPERNVEIWFRQESKDQTIEIDLSNAPPGTKQRDEAQHRVVSLGDLRPGEMAIVSGLVTREKSGGGLSFYGGYKGFLIGVMPTRVVSADRTATFVWDDRPGPGVMDFVYRMGFWAFVIVVLGAAGWAGYAAWRRRR